MDKNGGLLVKALVLNVDIVPPLNMKTIKRLLNVDPNHTSHGFARPEYCLLVC